MTIQDNPDKAMEDEEHDYLELKLFMDRSGMNGKISASTVLYKNNRRVTSLQYLLGKMAHHTIYKEEVTDTILATKTDT